MNEPTAFGESRRPSSPVKQFRDTHHMMARMFALGYRTGEVAERMGYSISRISVLRNSPAFEELVAAYRADVDGQWRQHQDEYLGLITKTKMLAARMLHDQLESAEENGEQIPLRTLLAIEGDGADRTGYAKRAVNVNINMDMAVRLDRAIGRSRKVQEPSPPLQPKLIDARPVEAAPSPLASIRRV